MKGSTFNQLTIFQAIVEAGSISGAARKMEMTAPSVSHALKQLENQLDVPLFTRSTRRIELTDAGEILHQRITDAISTLEYAVESVQDLGGKPSGKVSLTLPRFAYQFFLRPVYAEFCKRYPDIELEIAVSDEAVNIIERGYDVGIRFGDRIEPGMVAHQLTAAMRDALVASESYIARYGLPESFDDLQKHKFVRYRFIASNQLAPLILKKKGQSVTIETPKALIVNDTDAMVDAASKGLGIGQMIEPVVNEKLKSGELKPVLEKHWQSLPGLYIYFVQNSQKAKRVRALIDFLVEKGIRT